MKYIDHKVIKTAIGTFISIYLADLLGIKFGVTAGIVTIISIQATKKGVFKNRFRKIYRFLSWTFYSSYIL